MNLPEAFTLPVTALFSLLIGSFLNVCIYRVPRDLSVVTPRSFCPECGYQIPWYDNVPVASFLLLGGRCRKCGAGIGFRYIAVELITAILFTASVAHYGWTLNALRWAVFEALLIVLFWTDLEERILPDELTIGGAVVGFVFAVLAPKPGSVGEIFFPNSGPLIVSVMDACLGGVLLAVPIWLLGMLYRTVRKREGLGFGDVKLLLLLGIFLGPEQGLSALLIGTVSGSIVGIVYIWFRRHDARTYELPFGSFLCIGGAVAPFLPGLR